MDKSIKVLIVDDNELDIERIRRSFSRLNITNPLLTARDGQEAIEMLRGTNGHEQLKQPYFILLDLNMPRMSGIEFLEEIRADEELKMATIVVLTTSDNRRDIETTYKYNVGGYLVKPIDRQGLLNSLVTLEAYWSLNKFPGVG